MRVFIFLLILSFTFPALAVQPDEMMRDPAQEARARDISRHLRCLVCQGEAIDESNADFAKDLRKLVRERIVLGDTDEQVMKYLQDRYGDFILMKPPVENKTMLLWLTPALVLGAGLIVIGKKIRISGQQ